MLCTRSYDSHKYMTASRRCNKYKNGRAAAVNLPRVSLVQWPHRMRCCQRMLSGSHPWDASECFCMLPFPSCLLWKKVALCRHREELLQADLYIRLICGPLKSNVKIHWGGVKMGAFMMFSSDSHPFCGKQKTLGRVYLVYKGTVLHLALPEHKGAFCCITFQSTSPPKAEIFCWPPAAPLSCSVGWWAPYLKGKHPSTTGPVTLSLSWYGSEQNIAVLRALRSRGYHWECSLWCPALVALFKKKYVLQGKIGTGWLYAEPPLYVLSEALVVLSWGLLELGIPSAFLRMSGGFLSRILIWSVCSPLGSYCRHRDLWSGVLHVWTFFRLFEISLILFVLVWAPLFGDLVFNT